MPTSVQWRNIGLLGGLMFLVAYSCVFWAETRIPSGITAVLVATAYLDHASGSVCVKEMACAGRCWGAILLASVGLCALAWTSRGGELNVLPCLAVLLSSMSWSLGSVLSKRLDLPSSKALLAACEMMLGGGMLLLLSLGS